MFLVSYEFLGFLAMLAVLYYLVPGRFQWCMLLAASYLFYAVSGWKTIGFILITTVSVWWLGKKIGRMHEDCSSYIKHHNLTKEEKKSYRAGVKRRQWRLLLAGLIFNFGILAVLKYTNFALENVNFVLHLFGSGTSLGFVNWLLPLGVSYYTFQSAGYLIDVYRKKYSPESNLGHLALFVSFFPQLIQGPISRFDEMKDQFFTARRADRKNIFFGMQRMLWGYFKKLVVADRLLPVILAVSGDMETWRGIYVWIGMICYTIQIYADFSGGIDIVIGAAQIFGIRLPENFERPYFSRTVPEYWRRWHMSLMTWLREYIFYPASVCRPVNRIGRFARVHMGDGVSKRVPVYCASITVWLVVGIWHGATWGYLIWGLIHCSILLASQEIAPLRRRFHQRYAVDKTLWFTVFQILRTLFILSLVQMLEYYHTAANMLKMQWNMFTASSFSQLFDGRFPELGLTGADWIAALAGTGVMFLVSLAQRKGGVRERIAGQPFWLRALIWYVLFMTVLVFGAYGQGYDSSQFVYNQF